MITEKMEFLQKIRGGMKEGWFAKGDVLPTLATGQKPKGSERCWYSVSTHGCFPDEKKIKVQLLVLYAPKSKTLLLRVVNDHKVATTLVIHRFFSEGMAGKPEADDILEYEIRWWIDAFKKHTTHNIPFTYYGLMDAILEVVAATPWNSRKKSKK